MQVPFSKKQLKAARTAEVAAAGHVRVRTTAYLSFHRVAQCGVLAPKDLACRARVTPAI